MGWYAPPSNTIQPLPVLPLKSPRFPTANAVLDEATGRRLEYRHLLHTDAKTKWLDGCSKEFARLANGRTEDDTPGTNTIQFIPRSEIPPHKRPTYLRICANYRPQKADPYRVRCTIGGNLIQYPGPTAAPSASMPTIKRRIFSNSIHSWLVHQQVQFHPIRSSRR